MATNKKNKGINARDLKMVEEIIRDYARTWRLLYEYDEGILKIYKGSQEPEKK